MQNCRHSSVIVCARFKQTDKLAALIQTHKRSLVCNNTGLYIAVSPFICNLLFFFMYYTYKFRPRCEYIPSQHSDGTPKSSNLEP